MSVLASGEKRFFTDWSPSYKTMNALKRSKCSQVKCEDLTMRTISDNYMIKDTTTPRDLPYNDVNKSVTSQAIRRVACRDSYKWTRMRVHMRADIGCNVACSTGTSKLSAQQPPSQRHASHYTWRVTRCLCPRRLSLHNSTAFSCC